MIVLLSFENFINAFLFLNLGGSLSNQNEKSDDSKLGDGGSSNPNNSTNANTNMTVVNKPTTAIGSVTNTTINKAEITKDKDESSVIKD